MHGEPPQPQRQLGLLGQEFSHLGGCLSRTPALLSCRTSGSIATVWKNYKRWSERGGSLRSHQLSVKWEGSGSLLSHVSHVRLFATPWTVARQAPLSMGFSRQGYWSGLPCPPPGDLPSPGIKPSTVPGKPGQLVILVCKMLMSYQKQGLSSPKMFGMLCCLFPIHPSMTMYQKFTGIEAELRKT